MASLGALRRQDLAGTWHTLSHTVVTVPDDSHLAGLAVDAEVGQMVWSEGHETLWIFDGTRHIPLTPRTILAAVTGETPIAPGTAVMPPVVHPGDIFMNLPDHQTWIYVENPGLAHGTWLPLGSAQQPQTQRQGDIHLIEHVSGFQAGDHNFDLDWTTYARFVFEFTIDQPLTLRSDVAWSVRGFQMSSAGGLQANLQISGAASTWQQVTPGTTTGRLVLSRGMEQNSLQFVHRVNNSEHIMFQGFLDGINSTKGTHIDFRGAIGWVDITQEGVVR